MYRTPSRLALLLLTCCTLLTLPVLAANAAAALPEPGPTIITIVDGRPALTEPNVRVLEENAESVLMEFELPAIEADAMEIDGTRYDVLAIGEGDFEGEVGEPMLPTFSRLVQIPDRAGVTVEATVVAARELEGYRLLPMQPAAGGPFTISAPAYARSGYGPSDPAQIGEPALAGDLRVVPITFRPLRYDPSRETVEVAGRIQVRVNFSGTDLRNVPERIHDRITPSFDKLYRSLVLNYSGPRDGQILAQGTYVIICPNNTQVVSALQPLVEWRTRKGSPVRLATTAETGTSNSAIKTWLQNLHDTSTNPIEYICLVGDVSGAVAIPCWYENYSWENGETDHPYVQLAGGDILADAHIGRISVDSVDRLTLYVNKIVGYESTPYMTDTAWYRRGCVVGDASHSGYTCIQIMQWLKERMLDYGYAQVDTVFSSPFVSQMTAKLNLGDTAFSYRGYYEMSGFGVGNITALSNGWKMPYAVNCTCDTGSFSDGTSRSEAWIRAGTPPSAPTAGIASVGTATLGTDTRHNNCMVHGIWRGVFWDDLFRFGESLTRGKYELYINYSQMDYNEMCTFTCWNNLMGDPAGEMWTDIPKSMTVSHPTQLALGATSVTVDVTASGGPCAGAYVCLWKGTETYIGGYTDAAGQIELPVSVPTAGSMKITVTKHDHQPYLGTISVSQVARFVAYLSHGVDDDANGTSLGNADGLSNPTEKIELPVTVKNSGTQSVSSVTGTLTCDDPYVTILDSAETFGDIAAGATAVSADDFDIRLAAGTPQGHVVCFGLDITSGADTWHSMFTLPVTSSELVLAGTTLYNCGASLDPGETGQLSVRIRNVSGATATSVTGTLVSRSAWVSVSDGSGTFGTIAVGGAADNASDRFTLSASSECFKGHAAALRLVLTFSGGAQDTADFTLTIGAPGPADPTGPDAHGYYAFDNSDTGYSPYAPTYAWVEIDPTYGGSGTSVGLTDYGDAQDDSQTITLPFAFKYYGETFTRATICSNGWIAMGSTYLTDYRNWNIPGAGGPMYMIAPMWDDLYQSGTNRVYQKYDSANHRFIVQWSRLINNNGGATENFEAILYDPVYHSTDTGDGIIEFMYNDFTNCDGQQHYCTVGIENGLHTDGLMFTYYNYYNTGAAVMQDGRAIRFMPVAVSTNPRGTLSGTISNVSNGGTPVAGAQVSVVETGDTFVSGADGSYGGMVDVGVYTVTVTHPSFQTRTINNVNIIVGQTTTLNCALTDIVAPLISGTTDYGNTADATGPYVIQTTITDYSAITEKSLVYNAGGMGWVTLPLASAGGNLYSASVPGQPVGTLVRYYIRATDAPGLTRLDPAGAPGTNYFFWVLEPVLEDDMENGTGGWTHYVVTGGYTDQWHLSTQRNHTSGGATAWKFGDAGSGSYADLADGALVTETMTLEGGCTFTFWHWMAAEVSGSYPGYAYDGGLVEMSVDGGAWTQITPVGGYPYLIRPGSQPGPFAAETPVFSGTADWTQVTIDLTGVTGEVQIRFRFGSDGNTGAEGWYIDDVLIIGDAPNASDVTEVTLRPERVALYQNQPNPFGPRAGGTWLRFDLPQAALVKLGIFDVGGRLVRTLVDGPLEAGEHNIGWNGRDSRGALVESGVYFYKLHTGGHELARRMLLVR